MAKKGSFWSDFKEFISRGNILDMAVGVVIGGAFGKIVTGLVNFIINPIIGLLTGGISLDGLKTIVRAADEAAGVEEVAILWGSWIQTIIDFIIVAFCIFLVIRAIMKAKKIANAKKIAEEEKKAAEEKAKAEEEKKEAEAAAAALEAKRIAVEDATIRSENLLEEIKELLAKK
ncbi:MAG: large conductance mechanosensitive channel protein MscL [Clostridia bacterium]|nr:large conductance mechanosensitive channel protein MscL [Clostridia bacterium]